MLRLREFLDFDNALMAVISDDASGLGVKYRYHEEQPAVFDEWASLSHRDNLAKAIIAAPSRTISFNAAIGLKEDPELLDFTVRNRHFFLLAAAFPLGRSDSYLALSLRRSDRRIDFHRKDPGILNLLLPHISEAFKINQASCACRFGSSNDGEALCVFGDDGTVVYQSDAFMMLHGTLGKHSYLVPDFMRQFVRSEKTSMIHQGLGYFLEKSVGLNFVIVKTTSRLNSLTARELSVARLFGGGLSHKEIGTQLHISPSTARRHIESIYTKLKINNKAALAFAIQDGSPRDLKINIGTAVI